MAIERKTKKNTTSINMTLRLDPRSKYLIDLLSRHQKRSITGVIEWAVEQAGRDTTFDGETGSSFLSVIDSLWSTDESVRLVNLAKVRPDLLDYDELRIWETIKSSPDLWAANDWNCRDLDMHRLQEEWDNLLKHVEAHRLSRAVKPYSIL